MRYYLQVCLINHQPVRYQPVSCCLWRRCLFEVLYLFCFISAELTREQLQRWQQCLMFGDLAVRDFLPRPHTTMLIASRPCYIYLVKQRRVTRSQVRKTCTPIYRVSGRQIKPYLRDTIINANVVPRSRSEQVQSSTKDVSLLYAIICTISSATGELVAW